MKSINYEKAIEILNFLGDETRGWGKVVNEFIQNYESLKLEEKLSLSKVVPASYRYGLMYQYLGHFRRECKNTSISDLEELTKNSLLLIGLDNYEYEDRESTQLIRSFIRHARETVSKDIMDKSWGEVKDKIPSPSKEKLEDYIERLW